MFLFCGLLLGLDVVRFDFGFDFDNIRIVLYDCVVIVVLSIVVMYLVVRYKDVNVGRKVIYYVFVVCGDFSMSVKSFCV